MLIITVESKVLIDYLQLLQDKLDDLSPAMAGVGMELEKRVRQRFETRSDPLGAPWRPWEQSTIDSYPFAGSAAAARSKDGAGKGFLLERYSQMMGLSFAADATSVRVGFDKPYATYHEFGTSRMERRGLLFADPEAGTLAPDDERAVIDILATFLLAG